ncbi:MAG TPA: hypothetical protein VH134_05800 [Candidatus Dormibacteraeota bacterium]|jgi:hypothetical protein|nr:hypothetical protein [Candidatus Dormibacteraeota bacterium]
MRDRTWVVATALVACSAACGQSAPPPTPRPVPPVTVTESLHFTGALTGEMTAGDGALPLTHDEPPAEFTFGTQTPAATRCYDFSYQIGASRPIRVYEAVVAGRVGAHAAALILMVEPVQGTAAGAHRMVADNTPSIPGQGLGYLWVDDQFFRYPQAVVPGSLTVAADGLSGIAGFEIGTVPGGAGPPGVGVSGSWRCGPG